MASASLLLFSGEAVGVFGPSVFEISASNISGTSNANITLQISEPTPFVIKWKTDNVGEINDNQITIQTSPEFSYSFRLE